MIHPSYNELIAAINQNAEEDDNTLALNSRYSLVLATSKRARQLIAGAKPLVKAEPNKKPLSIAIDELYKGKVKIYEELSEAEDEAAAVLAGLDGGDDSTGLPGFSEKDAAEDTEGPDEDLEEDLEEELIEETDFDESPAEDAENLSGETDALE